MKIENNIIELEIITVKSQIKAHIDQEIKNYEVQQIKFEKELFYLKLSRISLINFLAIISVIFVTFSFLAAEIYVVSQILSNSMSSYGIPLGKAKILGGIYALSITFMVIIVFEAFQQKHDKQPENKDELIETTGLSFENLRHNRWFQIFSAIVVLLYLYVIGFRLFDGELHLKYQFLFTMIMLICPLFFHFARIFIIYIIKKS